MHIARIETHALDETAPAVDLDQSPAEVVFLSFSDSDLGALAAAADAAEGRSPGLRLASLSRLRHPYSVDLYIEKVCATARFVLVRLLGGMDYWRYGVDQLAAAARARGVALALVPGDRCEDARLDAASTVAVADLRTLWRYFEEGGPDNLAACLQFIAHRLPGHSPASRSPATPRPVAPFGLYRALAPRGTGESGAALIVFYRSIFLANDTAPVDALSQALACARPRRFERLRHQPERPRRPGPAGRPSRRPIVRRHPQRDGFLGARRWRRRRARRGRRARAAGGAGRFVA